MRRLLLPVSLLVAIAASGCSSCGNASSGGVEAGAAATVEPAVPAPDGLLAEAWIRAPDAAWAKVQRGVSGAVALLPPTVGELACGYAGLDTRLAQLVDGKGTSYAVLADAGGPARLAWVLALPLTDGATAAAMLLDGSDAQPARYAARDVGGMRVLSSRGERPLSAAAAIARRWLLVGSSDDDLARLGPYAYRTMPTREAPPGSSAVALAVPQKALAGPIASRLSAAWGEQRAWLLAKDEEQRAQHGGHPPDFGDARPIVEALDAVVARRVALVSQARAARVEIDLGDDDLHLEAFLTPGEGDAGAAFVAAMHAGDVKPLTQMPADAVVAVFGRDEAAARTEDARELEGALDRALGDRLRGDDSRAIHAAVDDWTSARGDWWMAAVAWGSSDSSRGLWALTPSADAAASGRAVRELVDLTHRHAFSEKLSGSFHLSPASVTAADVPSVGKASVATFAWASPAAAPKSAVPAPAVAWGGHDGELLLAAGFAAAQLLSAEAAPSKRIADDARSARALAALGSDVTFAVFAQPMRFDAARDATSAPAVVALGRKGGDAWLRVELADALLRELIRLKAGL
jgi:hypothetical protein